MNFNINLSKSVAFSLQTPENNLKPPYNPFKRQINVWQWFTTRGRYVHKPMVTFLGSSWKCYIFQFSQNMDGFRQNDSTGLLEFIKLCKQKAIRDFFSSLFTWKLYIGFNHNFLPIKLYTGSNIMIFLVITETEAWHHSLCHNEKTLNHNQNAHFNIVFTFKCINT